MGRIARKIREHGRKVKRILKNNMKKFFSEVFTLENFIMLLAIAVFGVSIYVSVKSENVNISNICLSFLSTVVISWIMTKKSSRGDFEKEQQKLAKVSFRHLGDVEKTALRLEQSIKDQIHSYKGKKGSNLSAEEVVSFLKVLDSRIDDLKDRIKSTNQDWFDLLAKEEQDKIASSADPEDSVNFGDDSQWDSEVYGEMFSGFADFDDEVSQDEDRGSSGL